jgi:outer membrane protein assembly factor BamB
LAPGEGFQLAGFQISSGKKQWQFAVPEWHGARSSDSQILCYSLDLVGKHFYAAYWYAPGYPEQNETALTAIQAISFEGKERWTWQVPASESKLREDDREWCNDFSSGHLVCADAACESKRNIVLFTRVGNHSKSLHAIDSKDGTALWVYSAPHSESSGCGWAQSCGWDSYVTSDGKSFMLAKNSENSVTALSTSTGKVQWAHQVKPLGDVRRMISNSHDAYSAAFVKGGSVAVLADGFNFSAWNMSSGSLVWTTPCHSCKAYNYERYVPRIAAEANGPDVLVFGYKPLGTWPNEVVGNVLQRLDHSSGEVTTIGTLPSSTYAPEGGLASEWDVHSLDASGKIVYLARYCRVAGSSSKSIDKIEAFSTQDASKLWSFNLQESVGTCTETDTFIV